MERSPLAPDILFQLGPLPVSRQVVTTWAIMIVLVALSRLAFAGDRRRAQGLGTVLEIVVEALASQVKDIMRRNPWPYLPLIGTLFLFLTLANLSALLPGVAPPTAHIETPAALAIVVFFSIHHYGIRARGLGPYIRHYIEPTPLLLPLNIVSEITRIFSLMIRLFGNIMSHEFVIAIVATLAGLLLPIPFMLLGIVIGIVQAYIFTVLASVFIGAAVEGAEA